MRQIGSESFPVLAVSCFAFITATSSAAAEVRIDAKVFIEVQADGKHCAIRKVKVLCADAMTHLREVLKLEPGTEVGVKAHQAAPFKEVKKMLGDVERSGFRHPVAHVQDPKDSKSQP